MPRELRKPRITVLAGTNGAGKSSIGGAALRQNNGVYFNPDEATQALMKANPGLSLSNANIKAWHTGKGLLEKAITDRDDFAFETTLGGKTITALLERAHDAGFELCVWYSGLDSPERHLARVAQRVARGGHNIPEAAIRRRYNTSRENLIRLLPRLTLLQVFDNSREADPEEGKPPSPLRILFIVNSKLVLPKDLSTTPQWAKAIVMAAIKAK